MENQPSLCNYKCEHFPLSVIFQRHIKQQSRQGGPPCVNRPPQILAESAGRCGCSCNSAPCPLHTPWKPARVHCFSRLFGQVRATPKSRPLLEDCVVNLWLGSLASWGGQLPFGLNRPDPEPLPGLLGFLLASAEL